MALYVIYENDPGRDFIVDRLYTLSASGNEERNDLQEENDCMADLLFEIFRNNMGKKNQAKETNERYNGVNVGCDGK